MNVIVPEVARTMEEVHQIRMTEKGLVHEWYIPPAQPIPRLKSPEATSSGEGKNVK